MNHKHILNVWSRELWLRIEPIEVDVDYRSYMKCKEPKKQSASHTKAETTKQLIKCKSDVGNHVF